MRTDEHKPDTTKGNIQHHMHETAWKTRIPNFDAVKIIDKGKKENMRYVYTNLENVTTVNKYKRG